MGCSLTYSLLGNHMPIYCGGIIKTQDLSWHQGAPAPFIHDHDYNACYQNASLHKLLLKRAKSTEHLAMSSKLHCSTMQDVS